MSPVRGSQTPTEASEEPERPTSISPARCAVITAAVSGRCFADRAVIPRRHPPATAGIQPARSPRAISHLTAYTSERATNSAPKNATFAAGADATDTGPPRRPKPPVCAGPGGPASDGVSFSNAFNRMVSARRRCTSARNVASSSSTRRTLPTTQLRSLRRHALCACQSHHSRQQCSSGRRLERNRPYSSGGHSASASPYWCWAIRHSSAHWQLAG